jgi:ribonuclease HI
MCNRYDEDGGHLFLKCKKVKQVWRSLLLEDIRILLVQASNARVMLHMILELPLDKKLLTIILLWDWWTTRNKVNAGERERSTVETCHVIQKHVADFLSTTCTPSSSHLDNQTEMKWSRPMPNVVKVNFDAAFLDNIKAGAWGFVVRSDTGDFVAAAAGKLQYIRSALQAETEACAAAVEGAVALGLHRVIFESDSKILVNALQTRSYDLSEIGVLVRDIRNVYIGSFDSHEFSYCPRECNRVAHELAQFGFRAEEGCLGWADEAPVFVSELVASDIAAHVF